MDGQVTNAEIDQMIEAARPLPEGATATFIYGLVDPETGEIRYVGKSIRPVERLQNHCNETPSNCHRSHWIQSLRRRGLKPDIIILEAVFGEWPWKESERFWIAYGRSLGWPLTNNTSGGDGVPDLPPETKERIAATWRGRKHTPEALAKMRAWRATLRTSDATRAKMSASQRGRQITWIDKIAAALCKFTEQQERDVRARLDAGERTGDLAREFGVHRTTISKIKMGRYR